MTRHRLMLFFAIAYAVEGIGQAKSGIIGQPLTYFLKEAKGWTPLDISAALAVLDVPWVIKPLYGLVSDFLPVFGYRRRSWLLLSAFAGSGGFIWVAIGGMVPTLLMPALLITAAAMAAASTVCGALLVETGRRFGGSESFVNQQWLWFNAAAVAAALAGGGLTALLSPETALRTAASVAALAPVALIIALPFVREDRALIDRAGFARGIRALGAAARTRDLWLIAAFLFCYYFSPGFGTPLYFELTDRLQFTQGFIGLLSAVSAAGWIAGGLAYRFAWHRATRRHLLMGSMLAGAGSTLLYLGLSGPVSAILIYFLSGMAGMAANVATLGLAADHCPEHAEGFVFAALMSAINLAAPLSDVLGAFLYERVFGSQLAPLIVMSAGFTLLVVPFAGRWRPA